MLAVSEVRLVLRLLAAVLTLCCLCGCNESSEAESTEQVGTAPQLYLGDGVTEAQAAAVLAELEGELPEGAAVKIEIISPAVMAGGSQPDWGFGHGLPPGFTIRPLDDPDNPYKDSYGEWDVWELENYQWLCDEHGFDQLTEDERMDFMNAKHDDPRLQDDHGHFLTVRGDGFLVPHVDVMAGQSRGEGLGFGWGSTMQHHGITLAYYVKTSFGIWSFGNIDEELWQRMERATGVAQAPAVAPIPRWLADNPPMWVMFIPDNEIITLGPLGSWDDEEVLSTGAWYRFSADGELLGQTTPYQQWWFEIFFPEFRQIWEDLGGIPDIQFTDMEGIISFHQQDTMAGLAVYSYKGEPDPDIFTWQDPPYLFEIFEGRDIPAMYAAQKQ